MIILAQNNHVEIPLEPEQFELLKGHAIFVEINGIQIHASRKPSKKSAVLSIPVMPEGFYSFTLNADQVKNVAHGVIKI